VLAFEPSPEVFAVEEIAAYAPKGEGSHSFLWVEKRDLTTLDAIARLSRALGVPSRDIGYAGLKDRHAVTRQWLSAPVDPERALAAPIFATPGDTRGDERGPDVRVLAAVRHPHKLRLGHLRGNRFEIVLTGDASDDELAALAARFETAVARGVPNRFGRQRFGAQGDNAAAGLAILRGERFERDARRRRLLLSALQSAVFNRALELRAARGGLAQVREGDVLQKVDSGGLFVTTDVAVDQARVDRGEIAPTGPLPGSREVEPPEGSAARALEDEAIAAVGARRDDFERAGRALPGARRPVVLRVLAHVAQSLEDTRSAADKRAVRLSFALPAGAYATVFVDALLAPA
jgi:tRNA pseudouridine13 synthase